MSRWLLLVGWATGALLGGCIFDQAGVPGSIFTPPGEAGAASEAGSLDLQGQKGDAVADAAPPDQALPDGPVMDLPPLLPPGSPCQANGSCTSGFCVDGVCCDSACSGPCRSCIATKVGTCSFVPAGADPDDDCATVTPKSTCGLDGTCDGKGGCRNYPAGIVCVVSTCTGPSTMKRARRCDGKGTCQTSTVRQCPPFRCQATAGQCFTSCAPVNDGKECVGYYGCDPTTKKCRDSCTQDSHCKSTGECSSNKCTKD